MKRYPAIATIEFEDIATGMFVTDVMIKRAPIAVLKSGTISPGRYLTLIGGSTAAVEESFREGLLVAESHACDDLFLPDVHPELHAGLLGARTSPGDGAVAILETPTVCSNLLATERALKGTDVGLVEIRLADSLLSGKGVSVLRGGLTDIQSAVDLALNELTARNQPLNHRILTAPHPSFAEGLSASTRFGEAPLVEPPDGEGMSA